MVTSSGIFTTVFWLSIQRTSCRVDTSQWIGLTHPLSPDAPVYSKVYTPMKVDPEKSKATADWPGSPLDGIFVAFRYIEFYEHTGTHIDAPLHFTDGGKSEDELTWEDLTGPLIIVDVIHKAKGKDQFYITANDFDEFVANHGSIEPNSFIFICSGWSQYFFTDKDTYTNNATCIDESAIDWLIENAPDMKGVGVEALSPECNNGDALFRLHTTILPQNKLIIENVGPGMEKLPPKGADLMIFPMHLKDGTGSSARLVAVLKAGSIIIKPRSSFGALLMVSIIVNKFK